MFIIRESDARVLLFEVELSIRSLPLSVYRMLKLARYLPTSSYHYAFGWALSYTSINFSIET
jgi:hypothetical protein